MSSPLGLVQKPVEHTLKRAVSWSAAVESSVAAPQADEEGSPIPSVDPEAVPEKASAPLRKVLIVEDTMELAEVIAATLERINIVSFHETHGGRALEVYHAERPDLVLLDIGLPDMTGWKIVDAIKSEPEESRPIVIVITAHGDPANRLMGKLQGVHSYLIKPFTPNEVEQLVTKALIDRATGLTTEPEYSEVIDTPESQISAADTTAEAEPPDMPSDNDGAASR